MSKRKFETRKVEVDIALFGNLDLEEIARTMGTGVIPTLIRPSEKDITFINGPRMSNTRRGILPIRTVAGDTIMTHLKRYEGPSIDPSGSTNALMHGRKHTSEALREARQLKFLNELFVPSPALFGIVEYGGVDSVNPIDILSKYIPGNDNAELLAAIRQELKAVGNSDQEKKKILISLAREIKKQELRTCAECQVKGTYTLRSKLGPDRRVDLSSLFEVYDPANPDGGKLFDPDVSRASKSAEYKFHVDDRFGNPVKQLIKYLNQNISDAELEEKTEELCSGMGRLFLILLNESLRTYSHGDENSMNAKISNYGKPNQPRTGLRALLFDTGNAMMAPFHLGAAGYLSDSTIHLSFNQCTDLAEHYFATGFRIENDVKQRKDHWKELNFRIFNSPESMKASGNRDLFLFDIAMLFTQLRIAGVSARHELSGNDYGAFVNHEVQFDSPFLEIPGENHGTVSYKPFSNRGMHGSDGRISRLLSSVDERLDRIISGRTRYASSVSDVEIAWCDELQDILKGCLGEEAFIYRPSAI